MAATMTARDVLRALHWHYSGRYAMLTEVSARPTGFVSTTDPEHRVRRIDALLLRMNTDVTGGIERIAIEVKVTRSDFMADVNDPHKQAPWRALAHRHAFATPAGLVRKEEVPANSGLLEVGSCASGPGTVKTVVRMPRDKGHDPGALPVVNIMDAFWRAGRAEAQMRGLNHHVGDDDMDLRARIKALEADLTRMTVQASRAQERGDRWRKVAGAAGPLPCSTCGEPLTATRGRVRYESGEWMHRDKAVADACLALRQAAADASKVDRWGAYVLPPEPADLAAVPA